MTAPHALQRRPRVLAALAAATLLAAGLLTGAAPAAAATGHQPATDTVGGTQLASPHRTVVLQPGAQTLPDVWADSWILADAKTGEVLAQKGSHTQRAPASTLKMLTALSVLPRTSPTDTYVATKRAASTYGSRVGLRPGRSYTLDELWYAVFLPSANDAAIAVAEANGGVRKTVREMQALADELGALDTVVRNTNGLDAPGQHSSAYDLALIGRAGLARSDFRTYAGARRAMFPDVKGKGQHPIYTTNRLLLHGFDGMLGLKTGFTTKAGRTYVGAAERGGRTLIVTLMGIHEASETAARKLLQWGFHNADMVTPIGRLVAPGEVPDPSAGAVGVATSAAAGVRSTDGDRGGSKEEATTAAAPNAEVSSGVPTGALVLFASLGLAAVVVVLAARSRRRPGPRHAAP